MINEKTTPEGKLMAILTAPGELQAVLTQGPMIVNDYVFQVLENETEYIFEVRRGSEVQSITFPKKGGSGGDGKQLTARVVSALFLRKKSSPV